MLPNHITNKIDIVYFNIYQSDIKVLWRIIERTPVGAGGALTRGVEAPRREAGRCPGEGVT